MQVYAGFPVLTNQPWAPQEHPELHELVGFADPERPLSAGEYAELAKPLVERELARHRYALIVGGSGLYMRAALAPLAATGRADIGVRNQLEERARSQGAGTLHAELAALDPEAAASIDYRNVRRVIRALESIHGEGGRWSGRRDLWEPEYYHPTIIVGLTMGSQALAQKIAVRTERMLDLGAVEEVRRFHQARDESVTRSGLPGICSAIGYGEICRLLSGELDRLVTAEQITAATRGYARRQGTWLRKVRDAVMIEVK
jgi:tRNA dimethylallyltransferase